MTRRLLVLGAGIYQLPLIRHGKELGFEVHVASRPGRYPGIGEAHVFHPIDTADVTSIVRLAKALGVAGVVTSGTDAAVPALAAANEALGLDAVGVDAARTLTRKGQFRELQAEVGLPYPRFRVVRDFDACRAWLDTVPGPAVIKPEDASGSRGLSRVWRNGSGLRSSFDRAMAESAIGAVCVEEALPGREFGGNALLADGDLVFLAVSAKHMDGVVVRGHEYPAGLSEAAKAAIGAAIRSCCGRLGYRAGPVNVDVMVDGDQVCLIEMAPRLGGNGMTDLAVPAFGYDVEREALATLLRRRPRPHRRGPVRPCGSLVVGAGCDGVLAAMASEHELRAACPFVSQLTLQRQPGDHVRAMVSNADLLGYVLFRIDPGMTWAGCAEAIGNCLRPQVRDTRVPQARFA
jgi:biotin carboxylase